MTYPNNIIDSWLEKNEGDPGIDELVEHNLANFNTVQDILGTKQKDFFEMGSHFSFAEDARLFSILRCFNGILIPAVDLDNMLTGIFPL